LVVGSTAMRVNVRAWRGLYAIVDPDFCRGRDPLAVARAVLEGGCAVLQLRSKRSDQAAIEALARGLLALCRAASVPFVINDRVELAQRIGAQGVHLGQTDMPVPRARELLGPDVAIGLSTHDLGQAQAAAALGADLIGFGPVFATATKQDPDPVVGLDGLRTVCSALELPVVAIGGISANNASLVSNCGASLAAAISALCSADDPRAAARTLHQALTHRA
jgi:thiamine-phosphate pyrophosphorylase